MSSFTSLIQHSTGILSTAIRQEEIKGIQTEKEKVKLSLFVDDIYYIEKNPKDSPPKNPTKNTKMIRTDEFSKVVGYKINIQKMVVFYTPKGKLRKQSHS